MKIAFFELEDWEREELSKGLFEGYTLHLSTELLRILSTAVENLRAFLRGQPQNLVNSASRVSSTPGWRTPG